MNSVSRCTQTIIEGDYCSPDELLRKKNTHKDLILVLERFQVGRKEQNKGQMGFLSITKFKITEYLYR